MPDGSVDTVFGNRVEAMTKTWTADEVSVSFDERKGYVAYCFGNNLLLYYPGSDYWAPPVDILFIETIAAPGTFLRSAFTLNGVIHTSFYSIELVTVTTAASSTTVNSSTNSFKPSDTGKKLTIPGAGPAGGNLIVTFTYVSANSGTMSLAATGTVTDTLASMEGFDLWTFDRDTNNNDLTFDCEWTARFSFGDYGNGLMPKTVTKAVVGMKSEATQHTLRFFRNFKTDAQMGVDRNFTTPSGNHINNIVDCNDGEGQLISVELEGNESRSKVFFIQLEGYASGIETNYGL
jgi:hypothetical protein